MINRHATTHTHNHENCILLLKEGKKYPVHMVHGLTIDCYINIHLTAAVL